MHKMFDGIEAVVFDFDGTLIDSMNMWHDIDVEYTSMHGYELPENFQKELEGMSYPDVARHFKKTFNIPKTIEEIMDDWDKMSLDRYTNVVELKPGSLEILRALKESGIKIAIATSNSRKLIEASLEGHNISEYFDALSTSDDVTKGKPDPEVYLIAASRLGIDPSKCLAFDDLPFGLISARDAGMVTCAVYDPFSEDVDEEKSSIADFYINKFAELF